MTGFQRYESLRDSAGLTDYRVATLAEITPSTLPDWKSGRSKPKADKLVKIARVLGCEIEDLVDEEVERVDS
jgi:transcriptional regulator with XRE-family HTH domain